MIWTGFLISVVAGSAVGCWLTDEGPRGTACKAPPDHLKEYELGRDATFDRRITNINRFVNEVQGSLNTAARQSERASLDELKSSFRHSPGEFERFVADVEKQFTDIESARRILSDVIQVDHAARACCGSDERPSAPELFRKLCHEYFANEPWPFRRSFVKFANEYCDFVKFRSAQVCAASLGDDPDLDAMVARYAKAMNDFAPCTHPTPEFLLDSEAMRVLKHLYFTEELGFQRTAGTEGKSFVEYVRWQVDEVITVLAPCP